MAKGIQVSEKNIKIALQVGSNRDVYASWSFSQSHTEKYEYEWEYTTSGINANKKVWFDGGTGSVNHPTKTATYSTPANATQIRFKVKPVSETHKVDKEDVSYYTGSWSSWIYFREFRLTSNPDPWQVSSSDLTITPYLSGYGGDSRPYVEVSWPVKIPVGLGLSFIKYLKGYDYNWEYREDASYTSAASGSRYVPAENGSVNDLTDAEKQRILNGNTVTRSVRLYVQAETTGGSTQHAIYDAVRCTIIPTATEEGAFRPVSNTVSKKIEFKTITPSKKNITITASKTTDDFTVFWTLKKVNAEHVASFDVTWEYAEDPKNYFSNVSRSADSIWSPGGTGSVNKEDGEVISSTSGGSKDTMRWRFLFKPSTAVAGNYPTVRVKIRAKCDDSKSFIEQDSAWKTYSFIIPTKDIDVLSVVVPNPLNPRHIRATWELPYDINIASFSYSYRYTTTNGGLFSAPSTGSVDIAQGTNSETGNFIYGVEFDVSSEARTLEFTVKPVPKVATAFESSISVATINLKGASVLTIQNTVVTILNTDNRVVYATWDPLDVSGIISSGVSLEDLGIPGSIDDYPAETLDSLIRTAVLSGYEVKWEYYFLNTWISGSGSSTTTSTYSEYTVPEQADAFRVSVKPSSSREEIMVGAFSRPLEISVHPSGLELTEPVIDWYGSEGNTLAARYSKFKAELPYIDARSGTMPDVTYEWSFFRYGAWESVSEENVTPNSGLDMLLSTKEVPTDAKEARVRIKPVIDTLDFYGAYSDFVTFPLIIPSAEVTDLIVLIQKGSKRTCVAAWDYPSDVEPDTVSGFSYEWQYSIDNIWYDASSGEASITALNATYDAPDNAEEIRVRVKPNPVLDRYFIGGWSSYIVFRVPDDITPEIPGVPSVEIVDIYNFKATVDTYDSKTSQIMFEVVNESSIWRKDTIDVALNRAVFQFPVAAGHVYRVRAAGVNAEGEVGEWSNYSSDTASAPPPLESPPDIRATSDTSVEINWTAPSTGVVKSYKIEYSTNMSYFDAAPSQVQTLDISVGTTAILQEMSPSEWFFRICTVNDAGQSDWVYGEPVILGSLPTAPTTWSSRTSSTIGEDVYLYWTHNCADESAETSAELELIINGEEYEPIEIEPPEDGSISYFLISGEDITQESVIEWRVRTMGVVPEYGEWSTQRIIKIYSPPSLLVRLGSQTDWEWDTFNFNTDNIYNSDGVVTPFMDNVVTAFPILVYLDAFPPTQTPTSYIMTVISNNSYEDVDNTGRISQVSIGQEVFKKYYNTQKSSFVTMLTPDLINLENGMSYTINVTVSMDSGLTAEASETFSVAWEDEDYILNAEISINRDTLVAYVRPYAMDENEAYPANVLLSVFRREFDGSYVEIGSKLSNQERPVVVDPHPALDYARYRIVAQSTVTGAISFYDLPGVPIKDTSLVLQWDEAWTSYLTINEDEFSEQPYTGSMVKLPYNVKVSESNQLDLEAVEYIGRRHPVSYYGTQVGQKMTLSSDIDKNDKELVYALRRLAVYAGDVYVREPNGAGYWAHVSVDFSIDYDSVIIPISIEVVRVEGGM